MPFAHVEGVRLYYRLEGNPELPALILSHSIGTDHGLWDPQVPDLLRYFRILRYDIRGHGASDAPAGDYSIEQLGRDVLALADAAGIAQFAFCGLSLGGMIGQRLAARTSGRVTVLVLANTSPLMSPKSFWDDRRRAVLEGGMAAVAETALQRCFSDAVRSRGDACVNSVRSVLLGTDPAGYAGCCAAIREMDHTSLVREIRVPTLVIAGDKDVSTPWSGHGEVLAREIAGAGALRLPAAHLSNLERPRSFTWALLDFIGRRCADSSCALESGNGMRRAMLGDEHVDRALGSATEFTRDFQDLITRYAWGTVWARPGLGPRVRRLLALAMLAALGQWEEFATHVRAGLARELEPCDLQEILLQTAIYAGVPAANAGFRIASEELKKPPADDLSARREVRPAGQRGQGQKNCGKT